jgi:hypothetical protein
LTRLNSRLRPPDEQSGTPLKVDLDCLTAVQRELWDESFPGLKEWTEGTICQATRLELASFGYMCMLECDAPVWPPELTEDLSDYGRGLKQYRENMRAPHDKEKSRGASGAGDGRRLARPLKNGED